MEGLKNKVIVITGGAGGLGKALAMEFYRQGCHLALIDVNSNELKKTKSEIETNDQKITVHCADVSDEKNIITARLEILDHHKRIDILVNNAAISISQYFMQMDLWDYRRVFEINFWGTIHCAKHFLPDLIKQDNSRIVNIISDFAYMGFPGKTAYGSSKSGVLGFTNALKTELADTSIKVCLIIPPPINTGLVRNNKHIDDKKRESEARFLEKNGLPLDKTAKSIVKQIRKGQYRVIVGTMMFFIDLAARFFPTLLHKLIEKSKSRFDFI